MPNWLIKRAFLSPDRKAVEIEGQSYTFAQLLDLALQMAGRFHTIGIQKGDTIGILQHNSMKLIVTIHALMQSGTKIVFYNTRLSAEELAYQFEDSGMDWLVSSQVFNETLAKSGLAKEKIIFTESVDDIKESMDFQPVEDFNLQETATIMYTSGTTGRPKGVMQSFGNHWWSAMGSMLNLGLQEEDTWLCAVPLFHISGLSILMRSVIYGMTVQVHPQFDVKKVNKAILDGKIAIMSVVSNMLNRLMDDLGERTYPKAFRCMLLGGGPAPLSLLETCKSREVPIYQTYGMTETSSQIATLSPEYSLAKLGSAGKALFPSQLKVVHEGKPAAPLITGEIYVKGPNVTKGYAHREQATKEAFENGWLKTGDLGYLDEEGFLFVVDRRSDLIISGGENVYPAEIESALMKHEAVYEAGVTGVPDERWGQVPIAFVVSKNQHLKTGELLEFCQSRLASYKVPKEIHLVDDLPRNASNKLLRRQLVKLLR
ncbi:o-succinylbenzoate--CoA ligase [Bacillus testis]|uniref:o-succinylbenzoate--CoA ligase n=1 Tax=Bacillus testis TaxID=1622072 RepID=UPI00067EAA56|nr:o-succinylbenzoate--CoA ligase [Bacillus testis]